MDKELSALLDDKRDGADNAGKITDYANAHADDPFNVRDLEQSDILEVLNGTYIAKRFFGRSCCWFSQKLNNHMKNGKPCEFTPEERKVLKQALGTMAWEIQELADNM